MVIRCLVALCVVICSEAMASAHYDDVHYAMTYCVARRVGFTPLQAHRIASADVSVDYSTRTEPVQSKVPVFTAEWGFQEPRWRFHAMHHRMTIEEADPSRPMRFTIEDPSAAEHKLRVSMQSLALFRDAVKHRNPGVYMHFSQDRVPHTGYDAGYGHWDPSAEGGTQGGSTDWLAFRDDAAAVSLYLDSAFDLALYMKKASLDRQRPKELSADDAAKALMSRLSQVNAPAPKSLVGDGYDDRSTYMLFVPQRWGMTNDEVREFVDRAVFEPNPPTESELGGLNDPKRLNYQKFRLFPKYFWPHNDGPNLRAAIGVINEALTADGMSEMENRGSMPAEPILYTIAAPLGHQGDHYDKDQYARWVIYGDLKINLECPAGTADKDSKIFVWLEPTRKGDQRYPLIDGAAVWAGQKFADFERLPLGQLEVEWRLADNTIIKQPVFLNRDAQEITLKAAERKTVVEYQGLVNQSGRLRQPNDVLEGNGGKVLESAAVFRIELDTGTVGGKISVATERKQAGDSGKPMVERYTGNLFSHVPYGWNLPEAARGETIHRGSFQFRGVDEEGPNVWSESCAIVLYRGEDLVIPKYPEYKGHFIVIFSTAKPDAELVKQVLSSDSETLPNGVLAVLRPVD